MCRHERRGRSLGDLGAHRQRRAGSADRGAGSLRRRGEPSGGRGQGRQLGVALRGGLVAQGGVGTLGVVPGDPAGERAACLFSERYVDRIFPSAPSLRRCWA
jgi:hypothetical protein